MKINRVQIRLSFSCILVLSLLLNQCSVSDDQYLDKLFEDYNCENMPGAAVMIIKDGEIIKTKCYGMADIEQKIPISPKSNFRLASVSKQFTAMSIMILKEQGKLDYNQTLTDLFPEFPDYGKNISIEFLLQHRSGLIDYEDMIPDSATIQVLDRDVLQMMMAADSTVFPPGTEFRYSNSGYAVLAMIVEKLSGKRYATFLYDKIFRPLGMRNSVAFEKGISTVQNRAFGYFVDSDSVVFSDQSITSAVLGDGGIYTSLDDMFIWDQALYTEKLVSTGSLKRAFIPALEDYGYGWRIDEYKGHHRVHHTGSTCGFRNVFQRFPEDHFSVLILTNRAEPDVTELANKIVDRFL
ncbi:MAG: beta-lactamase family protein [Candidatus Marinimicrobia bacterium]|nr:beta-lactamase family protein [Candidatus Neomarinimicrobiota bacterium]